MTKLRWVIIFYCVNTIFLNQKRYFSEAPPCPPSVSGWWGGRPPHKAWRPGGATGGPPGPPIQNSDKGNPVGNFLNDTEYFPSMFSRTGSSTDMLLLSTIVEILFSEIDSAGSEIWYLTFSFVSFFWLSPVLSLLSISVILHAETLKIDPCWRRKYTELSLPITVAGPLYRSCPSLLKYAFVPRSYFFSTERTLCLKASLICSSHCTSANIFLPACNAWICSATAWHVDNP